MIASMTRAALLALLLLQSATAPADEPLFSNAERSYWAFQPIADPPVPVVAADDWSTSPIDRFLLEQHAAHGLAPAPPASRRALLRRVTFDLTGLPPTPAETREFLGDRRPGGFARLVDRLLASPHYGERWGRRWLDVVRYADTTGQEADFVMRYAYRYRNYVIEAFNEDRAYDEFLQEQLAGDLLPPGSDVERQTRRTIATTFLMLGPKALAEADKEQTRLDLADELIDVTGRAFLGLTIACARCHDHKFDPIPTADYYALAGIFRGIEMLRNNSGITSMWIERTIPQRTHAQERAIAACRIEIAGLEKKLALRRSHCDKDLAAWEAKLAGTPLPATATLPDPLVGKLVAWFDAASVAAGDGPVREWKDLSPRGNHLVSIAPGRDPRRVPAVAGGRPVIRFAGDGHQALRREKPRDLPAGNSARSMFVVSIPRNEHHNGEFLQSISQVVGWGATSKSRWNLFQYVSGKLYFTHHGNDFKDGKLKYDKDALAIFEHRHRPRDADGKSRSTYWKNGRLDGTFVPNPVLNTDATAALVVGSEHFRSNHPHHCSWTDIAEVLIFNRELDESQRQQVGSYLAGKYRLDSEYRSPARLVRIPRDKRTPGQQQAIRDYYLQNHDPEYRRLREQTAGTRRRMAALDAEGQPLPVMVPIELGARTLKVHLRGNRFTLDKEPVPRRFLRVLTGEAALPLETKQSGRLELARWIASPDNPLTARVMVNRIWAGHFGRGLVGTPDNFGQLGQLPTHPRLLDWLAHRFISSGWSVKSLHRLLLLSSTYRQGTRGSAASRQRDPENLWLSRFNRRRLEAEEIRDAVLAVSGQLDRHLVGGGEEIARLYEIGDVVNKTLGLVSSANLHFNDTVYTGRRRSIYLPVVRNQRPEILSIFDGADPNVVSGSRSTTTVPAQAMFMLNSKFARTSAGRLADRLLALRPDNAGRVEHAFSLLLGRPVRPDELAPAIAFLEAYAARKAADGASRAEATREAWRSYCQLLLCTNEFFFLE